MTSLESLKKEFQSDDTVLDLINKIETLPRPPRIKDPELVFKPNSMQKASILKGFFELLLSDEDLDYSDEVQAWNVSWGGVKNYILSQNGSELGIFSQQDVSLPGGYGGTKPSNDGQIDISTLSQEIHIVTVDSYGNLTHEIKPYD